MKKPTAVTVFGVLNLAVAVLLLGVPTVFGAVSSTVEYRTDQILIQPKAGVSRAALTAFHAARGASVSRTFAAVGGSQVIALPAGETVPGLIAKYQQSGLVEFAEPDYIGHVFSTTPNDTYFVNGTLWGLNKIDAPDGWNVLTSASNIVVAVLDTGVRYTHQDLVANMWVNTNDNSHGWNALAGNNDPNDNGSSNIGNAVGHGTLVSGVLGAVGNNAKGVCGVAWRVQIMVCQCFTNGSGDGTVSGCITCMEFARTNGARIINASWGFPTNSLALSNAVVSLQTAGIILVAACGNSSSNIDVSPTYPSGYHLDNTVSVAATATNDTLSAYSNYGATNVMLAAPGDQIYSTWVPTDSFYIANSGTSFSAPYVSGALALMLAKYPTENYQQIIQRLLQATDPLPSLAGKCVTGGRLNLKKALNPPIWLASAAAANTGAFQLHLSTGANRQCVLQMSTNLISWTPVYTNTTFTNGTLDFTNTIGAPRQFFRAVATP